MREVLELLRDVGAIGILGFLAWRVPPLLSRLERTISRIEGFLYSQGMRSREETPPARSRG